MPWDEGKAWTGERTIAVFWRGPSGAWSIRQIDVKGSGPGTEFRFRDTGEPVTADEIRAMASAKRRQEKAGVRAYHARKGGKSR